MLETERTVSDLTGPLYRRVHSAPCIPCSWCPKFNLLSIWLCEGHFHSSCQTKGFTLLSLQPLYTHWNLLPCSERRKLLACSYFISELLFFLVTECIFKGWGHLWHWSEAILKKWKCNALLVIRGCVPELPVLTASMNGAGSAQKQQCKG